MPYSINNPPDRIKDLPQHAKEIWIAAFNSALSQYKDEGKANAVAWAAVETKYKKNKEGKWVAKKASESSPMMANLIAFGENFNEDTSEIKVIPIGVWNHPQYGKIKISEKDISEFVKNFDSQVRNDLPITEGHANEGETKPAIGWFKKLINKGRDGLWAVIEWTEKGKKLIQDKAYKYFSPEFYTHYEDPETRETRKDVLVGGALVNRPYFKGLPAIVLSEETIINNNMDIEEIITKEVEELTDEEKDFLKENKDTLSDEDKEKFASILEEIEEEKPEEKEEKEEIEETKETEEKTADEKIKGNVLIDSKTLKILEEKAEKGVRAMEELHKQKIDGIVSSLTFSEHNSNGTFLPKSKDKVVDFLLSLSDKQVEKFQEIIGELPKVKLFSEIGGDEGLPVADDVKLDTLVKAKMQESKLGYKEALEQVIADNPELAEKLA